MGRLQDGNGGILVRYTRAYLHRIQREILLSISRQLILHDQRAAAIREIEKAFIICDDVRTNLIRSDSHDDSVVLGKIAVRKIILRDHLYIETHLPYCFRYPVPAALNVSDLYGEGFEIENLHIGHGLGVQPMCLNMWICDRTHG